MKWFRSSAKRKQRDIELQEKMASSQAALLTAATETADAAHDVTLMLRNKLTDSLRQIEITSEILPDALIVCDSNGIIEAMNTASEHIFQWKKEEVMGKHVTLLFRDDEGLEMGIDQFIEKSQYCNETVYEVSAMDCVRGKRKNGEIFWVEISTRPLVRVNETAMVVLCRDATKRIELTRRIEDNEAKFRAIFESSADGIVVVENGVIAQLNNSFVKMVGESRESLIATMFVDLMIEEQKTLLSPLTEAVTGDNGCNKVLVLTIKGKDLLVSSSSIKWEGKESLLLTFKDLSFAV